MSDFDRTASIHRNLAGKAATSTLPRQAISRDNSQVSLEQSSWNPEMMQNCQAY